jgi:hypothetical protein
MIQQTIYVYGAETALLIGAVWLVIEFFRKH